MFWGLSEDLIFNDIEIVSTKDVKEINLSKIEKEKALKRIEELGEIKVVENYKAGKYFEIQRLRRIRKNKQHSNIDN